MPGLEFSEVKNAQFCVDKNGGFREILGSNIYGDYPGSLWDSDIWVISSYLLVAAFKLLVHDTLGYVHILTHFWKIWNGALLRVLLTFALTKLAAMTSHWSWWIQVESCSALIAQHAQNLIQTTTI